MTKTIAELKEQALTIMNETVAGANTAARLGGFFKDLAEHIDTFETNEPASITALNCGKIGIINCLDGNFFEYEKENLKIKTCARFDILTQGKLQRVIYSGGDYVITKGSDREQVVYYNTSTNSFGNKGYTNTTFSDKEIIIGIVDTTTKDGTFNFQQKKDIDESRIADLSISSNKIKDGAVVSSKLADYSVSEDKIALNAVSPDKTTFFDSGKNIINFEKFVAYSNIGANNGVYSVSQSNVNTAANESYIKIKANTNYVLSCEIDDYTRNIYWYTEDKTFISRGVLKVNMSPSNAYYCRVQAYKRESTLELSKLSKIQLEEGDNATEYEEPNKKKLSSSYYDDNHIKGIIEEYAESNNSEFNPIFDVLRPKAIKRTNQNCLNFGFITDTHIEEEDGDNTGSVDIKTIGNLAKEGWIDFVAHGGDVFNSYAEGSVNASQGILKETAINRICRALKYFEVFNCPLYVARGNHDVNGKYQQNYPDGVIDVNQKISQEQFKALLQNSRRGDVNNEFKCSFYKDFDDKKIRVIVLDVYYENSQSATFTHDTLDWLANTALKLESKSNYSVLLLSHTFEGSIMDVVSPLIMSFKNGTQFSNERYNVNANFTTSGDFIACVCGHTHSENESSSSGFLYITSSTSYLKTNSNLSDKIYANVFTIDKDNKIIYKQKIGTQGHNVACNWETLTITEIN